MVFVFLWFVSLSIIPLRRSMLLQMAKFHSFLWMSGIPLCICHVFFIHPFVDGHLGSFYILTIINNAAMNNGVHVPFWINFFWFFLLLLLYTQRWNFFHHMVVLFLVFWETSILFSTVDIPIYIPTNSIRVFFPTLPPTFVVFHNSHFDRCEVTSYRGFDLHFPTD